jgi:hypothetical protein
MLTPAVIDLGVAHTPYDRELVGDQGRLVHVGAETDARQPGFDRAQDAPILSRRVRLRIEAVHVGKPALEVNMNN